MGFGSEVDSGKLFHGPMRHLAYSCIHYRPDLSFFVSLRITRPFNHSHVSSTHHYSVTRSLHDIDRKDRGTSSAAISFLCRWSYSQRPSTDRSSNRIIHCSLAPYPAPLSQHSRSAARRRQYRLPRRLAYLERVSV